MDNSYIHLLFATMTFDREASWLTGHLGGRRFGTDKAGENMYK
jgi:hypothetical protein